MAKSTLVKRKGVSYRNVRDDDFISVELPARDTLGLSKAVNEGVKYSEFRKLSEEISLSQPEWANLLHISDRTLQRYKTQKKTFDPIYSDKILQIAILYSIGNGVFGDKTNFHTWLETKNVALGGAKPKELLNNTFGISLVEDELRRIETGVLA